MKFEGIAQLNEFVLSINDFIHNEENHSVVQYPRNSVSSWNVKSIEEENEALLNSVSGSANIYAIFELADNNDKPTLKYIGKTTRRLARQRLRNHLITKHAKTGAKLESVKDLVRRGHTIKIAYLPIEPESLRNYVEEELIFLNKSAEWNRENA
ncbi:hypothetical protein ACSKZ4_004574 [Vibrio alginolyticus]